MNIDIVKEEILHLEKKPEKEKQSNLFWILLKL